MVFQLLMSYLSFIASLNIRALLFFSTCLDQACRYWRFWWSAFIVRRSDLFLVRLSGGGVTQLVMPYLATEISKHTSEFLAWRWSFFLPGAMFVMIGFAILVFAQVCLMVLVGVKHQNAYPHRNGVSNWTLMLTLSNRTILMLNKPLVLFLAVALSSPSQGGKNFLCTLVWHSTLHRVGLMILSIFLNLFRWQIWWN